MGELIRTFWEEPDGRKCKECPDWKPVKKYNYAFGICRRDGDLLHDQPHSGELEGVFKDEVTRHKNRTRPWHICDVAVPTVMKQEVGKVTEKKKAPEKKGWTTKQTLAIALEEARKQGVPIPKAIEGLDEDDIFPTANDMDNQELGKLLFKYGALKGYAAWLAMTAKVEYKNTLHAREIMQGQEVNRLEKESEKKRLKDSLFAEAIEDNEKLRKIVKMEIELEAKVLMYERLFDIYSSHWDTISREISRRADEMKYGGMYQGS